MIVTGRVVDFDEAAGLGSIAADDGATFDFHCIVIADGTRTIEPGRRVAFRPLARFGREEAADIVKL